MCARTNALLRCSSSLSPSRCSHATLKDVKRSYAGAATTAAGLAAGAVESLDNTGCACVVVPASQKAERESDGACLRARSQSTTTMCLARRQQVEVWFIIKRCANRKTLTYVFKHAKANSTNYSGRNRGYSCQKQPEKASMVKVLY